MKNKYDKNNSKRAAATAETRYKIAVRISKKLKKKKPMSGAKIVAIASKIVLENKALFDAILKTKKEGTRTLRSLVY